MTGAFRTLVRHFMAASLAPEVLTELGVDYLRRTIFGVLAILLVLGSFLPRVFFHKYTMLGAEVGDAAYLRALQSDTLFMIAVPMVLIGLATVIAGPLLFPDETDYRVLTPLPISRAMLFGAKLVAVVALVGMAIVAVNAVATFWFPIAVAGRKAPHPLVSRVVAHAIAATAGSIFMCVAVMAIQGLMIVAVPASLQRRVSVFVQAAIGVGLLLSLPLISRLSGMNVTEATIVGDPLRWLPASWFAGVEWWLLDGALAGGYSVAARTAVIATLAAFSIVVGCYAGLYRSAERLAGVSGADRRTLKKPGVLARAAAARLQPQTLAILEFIAAAIGRSRLHQFVFALALGGGVAILIGRIVAVIDGTTPFASRPGAAVEAAIAAPLIVALTWALGLRAAYRWPLDHGAAWVFRVTEEPRGRAAMLDGAMWALAGGAWVSAMMTGLVLQPRLLGAATWAALALSSLAIFALAELLMIDWRRVPFACSYLPGTRVLAYHLGVLFAFYFVFVLILSAAIRANIVSPLASMTLGGFLIAAWAALRRERIKTWGVLALEFEDVDPADVQQLKL
jgi:hypothetical protein